MQYRKVGNSGLVVSAVALGCLAFGDPNTGRHVWTLPESDADSLIGQAIDDGINFFDTANVYSLGSSEQFLGRALKKYAAREDVVISTKVGLRMRRGPYGVGVSRKAIMREIDESLRRLQIDYVDLYQIHRFDNTTPLEETLEALHDVVRAGKARYIGASSMPAWQFAKALYLADQHGWTRFVSMQNHYNLLYREEEREMIPLCRAEGVGILVWSPLARGRLTRPWGDVDQRGAVDDVMVSLYGEADRTIVEQVLGVAARRGVTPAQVSIAWLLQRSAVTAPIIGAISPEHVSDAVRAVEVELEPDEITLLESAYVPHTVAGFDPDTNRAP